MKSWDVEMETAKSKKPYSTKLSLPVHRVVDGVRLLFGGLLTPSKRTTLWTDH